MIDAQLKIHSAESRGDLDARGVVVVRVAIHVLFSRNGTSRAGRLITIRLSAGAGPPANFRDGRLRDRLKFHLSLSGNR